MPSTSVLAYCFFAVVLVSGQHGIIAGVGGFSPLGNRACTEAEKITADDIVTLPQHKYADMENCLYYKLSERNRNENPGSHSSLYLTPPEEKDKIKVTISNITIYSIYLPEINQEAHLSGYFEMSWRDKRMEWDSEMSPLSEMKLQAIGHIWIPDISGKNRGQAVISPEYLDYTKIMVNRQGGIRTQVNFNLQAFCSVNQEHFPFDTYSCEFGVKSNLFDDIVDIEVEKSTVSLHKGYKPRAWKAPTAYAEKEIDESGKQVVALVLSLQRQAGTLKTLLFIPMGVCGALFVFSPLISDIIYQIYFKLFLLGPMELYSLQFLASRTSQHLQMTPVPLIYKFYELTILLTLISTLLSMLMLAFFKGRSRQLPPPEVLKTFASKVSKVMGAGTRDMSGKDTIASVEGSNHFGSEWGQVADGIHFLAMAFLIIVYFVGLFAIYA